MFPPRRLSLALAAALLTAALLHAAPAPSGGTPVIAPGPDAFRLADHNPAEGRAIVVAVADGPVDQAWRIETIRQPAETWKLTIRAMSAAPVRRGDALWVRFFLRGLAARDESGEARTTVVFETASPDHSKSIDLTVGARHEWREFCFPFACRHDLAAGEAQLTFRAGFRPQAIELGGIEVLNYGKDRALASLPRTRADYPGRAADAPWRAAAAERIAKIRKADLAVRVTDGDGRPVRGATVEIAQQRHAFGFGSAISSRFLLAPGPDGDRYRETVERHFSKVVFENELKWEPWSCAGGEERRRTLAAIDWLAARGIRMRGHVLVWPSWGNMLPGLRELRDRPDALRQRVNARIDEMMAVTRGRFDDWDVINEPYAHHDLMDALGKDAMVEWFRRARAADPKPTLFLNDYAGLAAEGMDNQHKRHFEQTARFLVDQGAPIGGLGLQCHFGWSVTPPQAALAELDRWAALGLTIHITEFDIESTDEQLQADYTRDLLTLAFSHPAVSSIMTWGFWEGRHWRPDAAQWRTDWSLKPNGKVWTELTGKTWWSNETGTSGGDGTLTARAFLGRHRVSASLGGRSAAATVDLAAAGASVELRLR